MALAPRTVPGAAAVPQVTATASPSARAAQQRAVQQRLQKPSTSRGTAAGKVRVPKTKDTPATAVPEFTRDAAYVSQKNTNGMNLDDFDAQTLLGRQNQVTENGYQQQLLRMATTDAKNATAEDYASRGILRSGSYLDAQDRNDTTAVQQGAAISQGLTDYDRQRSGDRLALQQTGRGALDNVLTKLQSAFYKSQKKAS